MVNKIKIVKTSDAKDLALPKYMTTQSAGMDLYAKVEDKVILKKGEILKVPTGIKIALPEGFEAQIRSRSGLAFNYGITMINGIGTIDADFRGEISVLLSNFGKQDFIIKRGDRIAQIVINKIEKIEWDLVEELDKTERGEKGYGHTGK